MARREALLRDGADVLPVDADRAASYIVEARNELAERGLASAGRPTTAIVSPGLTWSETSCRNVQLALVGEADVVDVNRAVDLQLLRIGCIIQRGFGAHDLDEALESCRAVGEHLGEVRQLADRVDERGDIERERQQVDPSMRPCMMSAPPTVTTATERMLTKNSMLELKCPSPDRNTSWSPCTSRSSGGTSPPRPIRWQTPWPCACRRGRIRCRH